MRPDAAPSPVLIAVFASILWVSLGCASGRGDEHARAPLAAADRSERIAALETSIAQDHLRLEAYVTEAREGDAREIYDDAALREIAEHLMRQTAELEALETAGATPVIPEAGAPAAPPESID